MKPELASFTLFLAGCATGGSSVSPTSQARVAVLGVETSAPSQELAEELGLPFKVRQQCRVVASATDPAASAGVGEGDVLYAIDDVLRVSRPGDEVVLALRRRGEPDVQKIRVVLGAGEARATKGIAWRYASLASLPRALEEARSKGRNVLVGLSGAET
jgi:hypothetical protein